jgi:hypothetical protein
MQGWDNLYNYILMEIQRTYALKLYSALKEDTLKHIMLSHIHELSFEPFGYIKDDPKQDKYFSTVNCFLVLVGLDLNSNLRLQSEISPGGVALV